jgi:MFS family permease
MADANQTAAGPRCNPQLLFVVSCVALVSTAFVFNLRGTILADLGSAFAMNMETVGKATSSAFLAFAIAIFIGSPLCDVFGMRALLRTAALLQLIGVLAVIFTPQLTSVASPFALLWGGMFVAGMGNGLVEAVINPLAATLYPNDKTHRLNVLHAWWPGGLIMGGLIGFVMSQVLHAPWQITFGISLAPVIVYTIMLFGCDFPATERVAAGVSNTEMWRQVLQPLFIIWFLCMFLTAATELGPGQWVDAILTKMVGMRGILLFVYVSGLMFVLRHFAGPLAHKFSPVGLMWISSLLAGLGLLAMSAAHNPIVALLAATVWGAGVCYMWPTMLGVASERFPKGGALLMGLMGTAGQLSIFFVVPLMGKVYDAYTTKALPAGMALQDAIKQASSKVPGAQDLLDKARTGAAPYAFRYVAALAIVLLIAFGIIWLRDRAKGGYQAVKLTAAPTEAEAPTEPGQE